MRMGIYTRASTANPTGRRPWNSRLSFYVPNTFNPPTAGSGPFLFQPGVTGSPAANGGLGFYKRARYPLPTTSMSGLGQAMPTFNWGPPGFVYPSPTGTRLPFRDCNGNPSASPGMCANPLRQVLPIPGGVTPPVAPVRIRPSGFQPVGTSYSGAGVYTSAPGLSPEAAGQGYYQVGTDAAGNPIYSTNPSAAQLYQSQQAAATGTAPPSAAPPAAAAPASSISDLLSQDSLGFGLSNAWYLGIAGVGLFLLMGKKGR